MTDDQPDIDDRAPGASAGDAPTAVASAEPGEPVYEREEGWIDDAEELPPRPRRRLLTPIPLTLLAILAIACGFIGGVLVEKGQGSSTSAAAGGGGAFASRLAALSGRSGAAGTGSASSSGSGSASASGSGAAAQGGLGGSASGRASGAAGGAGGAGATVGQVAYISKGTLYVTTSEGNTVKVTAAPGATVTKSVKTTADRIHPGETVVITGTASANGAIAAQSIRAGSAGAGGLAGAAGLFGGSSSSSGATRTGSSSGGASSGGGSGEQALFGKG
jgi:hypothetical protein